MASKVVDAKAKVITGEGLCISPGWIDLKANFCDPGFEYKEDIESGMDAARRGGFKTVVLTTSTLPVIDSKSSIEYIRKRATGSDINLLAAACLSEKMEGKQLSEMYDLHQAGAVAFSDDKGNVSTELMSRAIEYAKNFGGLVMSFPFDRSLCQQGQINEGATSVSLGMKGIPNITEDLRIQRDIELLRYNGGRLHFTLISTAKSVDLIRKAKREGLNITCAVAAHQFSFLDEDLQSFDTHLKVLPPFRSKEDRKALLAGLKDGTIDAICSDHSPEDVEHKVREFEDAQFGINGIETAFCAAFTALEKSLSIEEIIAAFTSGPARVLGYVVGTLAEGQPADVTVFSTAESTTFQPSEMMSKSANNPFIGTALRGKILY